MPFTRKDKIDATQQAVVACTILTKVEAVIVAECVIPMRYADVDLKFDAEKTQAVEESISFSLQWIFCIASGVDVFESPTDTAWHYCNRAVDKSITFYIDINDYVCGATAYHNAIEDQEDRLEKAFPRCTYQSFEMEYGDEPLVPCALKTGSQILSNT